MTQGGGETSFKALAGSALLAASATGSAAPLQGSFPVVELRQYTLHEGQRETLVELFDREFVDSQEALGMKIIGTFIDLDRPNRFVWLRGYQDMETRADKLTAFYSGPVWKANREAANATMIDSDNVLLLRAPDPTAQFKLSPTRPGAGDNAPAGIIVGTIYYLKTEPGEALQTFQTSVMPRLKEKGVSPIAWFVPETAANNFPALPVREGERVLVWFAPFASAGEYEARRNDIEAAAKALEPMLERHPELLRLKPTPRSQLRGIVD